MEASIVENIQTVKQSHYSGTYKLDIYCGKQFESSFKATIPKDLYDKTIEWMFSDDFMKRNGVIGRPTVSSFQEYKKRDIVVIIQDSKKRTLKKNCNELVISENARKELYYYEVHDAPIQTYEFDDVINVDECAFHGNGWDLVCQYKKNRWGETRHIFLRLFCNRFDLKNFPGMLNMLDAVNRNIRTYSKPIKYQEILFEKKMEHIE